MTNFNWKIEQLDYDLTAGDAVTMAHWSCTAIDSAIGYSARSYGACNFRTSPEASGFVQYSNLTEEIVLGWCFEDGIDQVATEESLQANIDLQTTPVKASGVPW